MNLSMKIFIPFLVLILLLTSCMTKDYDNSFDDLGMAFFTISPDTKEINIMNDEKKFLYEASNNLFQAEIPLYQPMKIEENFIGRVPVVSFLDNFGNLVRIEIFSDKEFDPGKIEPLLSSQNSEFLENLFHEGMKPLILQSDPSALITVKKEWKQEGYNGIFVVMVGDHLSTLNDEQTRERGKGERGILISYKEGRLVIISCQQPLSILLADQLKPLGFNLNNDIIRSDKLFELAFQVFSSIHFTSKSEAVEMSSEIASES